MLLHGDDRLVTTRGFHDIPPWRMAVPTCGA
jgi:hypothetical protein